MLLFALTFATIVATWGSVELVRTWAVRRGLLDVPVARSAHLRPVPRLAGVPLAVVIAVGVVIGYVTGVLAAVWVGVAAVSLLLLAVGLTDDLRGLPATPRLIVHFIAAAAAVWLLGPLRAIGLDSLTVEFGAVAVPLTLLWMAGFINAFNFMDGIDGLAGVQAATAGLAWLAIGLLGGHSGAAWFGALLVATGTGFLFHNWFPARIFLGDAGATVLGFWLAVLPLGVPDPRQAVVGLLALWPVVFDATWTLMFRVGSGAVLAAGHQRHYYQRLVRAGWTHASVASLYGGWSAVCAASGLLAHFGVAPPGVVIVATVGGAAALVVLVRGRERAQIGDGRPRLFIASELMHPEVTSTGFYISAIAERLGRTHGVEVVCAQPTYAARGARAPAVEAWRGVTIRRVRGTTFDKDGSVGRVCNLVTFTLSAGTALLSRMRSRDVVLVVTNPPALPFVVALACWWRRSRYVILIHDLYPDMLVAAAGVSDRAPVVRLWHWVNRRLFAGADRIIVVGRDMRVRLQERFAELGAKIDVIPNWAEIDAIRPADRAGNRLILARGLSHRFVVLYAGNMGRPNDLATIVEGAERLRHDSRFHFLFIGAGAKSAWLGRTVEDLQLSNVSLLGQQPRSEQQVFLNAADLSVVTLVRGMRGLAVPSRLYNFLAAGKSVLGIAETGSEIDLVIRETCVGWVTPPGDVDGFVAALVDAASQPARLVIMGERARRAAEQSYSGAASLDAFESVIAAAFGRGELVRSTEVTPGLETTGAARLE